MSHPHFNGAVASRFLKPPRQWIEQEKLVSKIAFDV